MSKKTVTIDTKQRAYDRLGPIRAWARANQGMISRLADRVAEITGHDVNRHMISRWLHEDPEKFVQPSFGYGLALEDAYKELC